MAPGAEASLSPPAPLPAGMRNLPVPALARPELIGPFDPAAYKVDQFDFGPKPDLRARGGHGKLAAVKKPNMERVKRVRRVKELSATHFDDEWQRAALEAFKKKAGKHVAVAVYSPRKKLATVEPELRAGEEAEFEEDPALDAYVDIVAAKASIRNHLMTNSPVRTAATKRRVNGLARNWIRAHKDDPDVKYLLSFPGEMPLERCLDLLGRRDMLSLDPVEETSNGSLVMPAESLPAATLTSQASRQQKLESAQKQLEEAKEEHLVADSNEAEENEPAAGRTFSAPSFITDTTTTTSEGHSVAPTSSSQARLEPPIATEQPQTPPVQSSQEILDVDLNQNPDIFASAAPPRRHPQPPAPEEAATPTATTWAPTTPQAPPSPTQYLDVEGEVAGEWSALASSPGVVGLLSADDTMDTMNAQSDSPTVELPENPTFVFGEASAIDTIGPVAKSIEALAELVSPIRELPDSRVVMHRQRGRFVVRFKMPEAYADAFDVEMEQELLDSESEVVVGQLSTQEQDPQDLHDLSVEDIVTAHDAEIEIEDDADDQQGQFDDVTAVPDFTIDWARGETPTKHQGLEEVDEIADAQKSNLREVQEEQEPAERQMQSMERAEPQEEHVADEFDRDFLRQFMTKHQAGKAKASTTPPVPINKMSDAPTAATSAYSPSPVPDRASSAPAEVPRTPEDAHAARMWVETPTFTLASEGNTQASPIRSANSARSRSSSGARTPLGKLDKNSPSPVKATGRKRKYEDPETEHQPDDDNEQKGEKKDGTDASNDDVPEKAQKAPDTTSPSPKRRRGLRARRPIAPPTPIPATARTVRSGEKDLASLTRANTRANKGNASMPQEVLDKFAADPIGQKWKERKEVVDAKAARAASVPSDTSRAAAKSVRWAEMLAEYEDGSPPVDTNEMEMKDDLDPIAAESGEEDEEVEVKASQRPRPKRGRPVGSTSRAQSSTTAGKNGPAKSASAVNKTTTTKATTAKTTTAATAPSATAKKPPQKSKLPAPVGRSRAVSEESGSSSSYSATNKSKKNEADKPSVLAPKNEGSKVAKPAGRPTRAAAQKSNLSMGLTATGTPIPKARRGRPASSKK